MSRMRMDERGVSPVIGVILMVAITVVLASVIAVFVFGAASNIEKKPMPTVIANKVNDSYVALLLTDMGGASEVKNCTLNGNTLSPTNDGWDVGEKIYVEASGDITVVCKVDGKSQVVLDTRI